MNQFQKVVLISSTIILIVSLMFLAYFLTKSLHEDSYPAVISDCPDFWDVTRNEEGETICKNTSTINRPAGTFRGIGEIKECRQVPTGKFSASGDNDDSVLCEKYEWAKKCNITWDGVTNNNRACDLGYN